MSEKIQVIGMVLFASPYKEYDKRVVLLTTDYGKVTAFCRGARSPKSALAAATEPFVFGTFSLLPGKEAFTLTGADISNYFMELRENLSTICYASYFAEFVNYYARENMDGTELLKLLYQTLRVLCKQVIDEKLVRRIFELKILVLEGEYPQCFSCCCCGKSEDLVGFSQECCGVICSHCMDQEKDAFLLHPSTIYTMQFIIAAKIEKLYTFTVSDEVLLQLGQILDEFLNIHVDRHFQSLDMLETL